MNFFTIICGIILLVFYSAIVIQPAELANFLSKKFFKRLSSQGTSGFWSLFELVKNERFTILLSLVSLIIFFSAVNLSLFNKIDPAEILPENYLFIWVSIFLAVLYGLIKFFIFGKVRIPTTAHGSKVLAERILENLSITAGVAAPPLVVLAHTNPTIFSLKQNFKQTTIYITSSMLNLCSKQELEAVLARELAFHALKRNSFIRQVNNLILFFELVGFAMLFLVLYLINPELPTLIVIVFLISYAQISLSNIGEFLGNRNQVMAEVLIRTLNPPLAIAIFLSNFIKYSLTWREAVSADLKSIDYTRYPKGLYSALQKIQSYNNSVSSLPQEYSDLYFTGERTVRSDSPMFQAPIQERLDILSTIDSSLTDLITVPKNEQIFCPVCLMEFQKQSVQEDVLEKIFYVCASHNHFWFDNNLIYQLSAPKIFKSINQNSVISDSRPEPHIDSCPCPRCKIPLFRQPDPFLPQTIDIWHCSSCQGDLISSEDFAKYVAYRATKTAKT